VEPSTLRVVFARSLPILLIGTTLASFTGCSLFRNRVAQAPTRTEQLGAAEKNKKGTKASNEGVYTVAAPKKYSDQLEIRPYRDSEAYCRNIAIEGQNTYRSFAWWGGLMALSGTAGSAAAGTWAANSEAGEDRAGKVALAVGTAVFAAGGLFVISRARAAARASAAAGIALGPEFDADPTGATCAAGGSLQMCAAEKERKAEKVRWQMCLQARGDWLGGNADALTTLSVTAAAAKEAAKAKEEVKRPATFNAWLMSEPGCTAATPPGCYTCVLATIPVQYAAFIGSKYSLDKLKAAPGDTMCTQ